MKKILSNTYVGILFFVLTNIVFSYFLKRFDIINEYVFMLIDLIISFSVLASISFYITKNNISRKQLFGELALIGVSGAFFIGVYNFVYYEFINHSEIDKLLNNMRREFIKQGFSYSQIEQGMRFSESFTNPIAISLLSFLGYSFSVLISALVCRALFQTTKNETKL